MKGVDSEQQHKEESMGMPLHRQCILKKMSMHSEEEEPINADQEMEGILRRYRRKKLRFFQLRDDLVRLSELALYYEPIRNTNKTAV